MKKIYRLWLVVGMSGFAASGMAAATDACAPIRLACEVAGYKLAPKGATQAQIQSLRQTGKDLTFNCLRPTLQGKGSSVAGLTVSSSWDLAACKAQIAAKIAAMKASGSN